MFDYTDDRTGLLYSLMVRSNSSIVPGTEASHFDHDTIGGITHRKRSNSFFPIAPIQKLSYHYLGASAVWLSRKGSLYALIGFIFLSCAYAYIKYIKENPSIPACRLDHPSEYQMDVLFHLSPTGWRNLIPEVKLVVSPLVTYTRYINGV